MDFDRILIWASEQAPLYRSSIHGAEHWLRVWQNGGALARATSGSDVDIIRLFAYFHDCQRQSEGRDPDHGRRAAAVVESIRATLLADLRLEQFSLLQDALCGHNDGLVSSDPTVGCCWDADRLELPRVGIRVQSRLLSTQAAKKLLGTLQRCAPTRKSEAEI